MERCLILCDGDYIDVDVLPLNIKGTDGAAVFKAGEEMFGEDSPIIPFERLKEEAIKHALKMTEGNIVEAAKKLKIGRATFYRLMDKYKIPTGRI